MKRIGGLVLVAVCMGALSNCASPLGLGARDHGDETGDFHNLPGENAGGGSGDSGVADATATRSQESKASSDEPSTGGGVLPPLGEFDRHAEDFELFDPCVEIPESRLEDAGLSTRLESTIRDSGYSHCGFEVQNLEGETGFVGLGVTDVGIRELENQYGGQRIYQGEKLPVVALKDPDFGRLFCTLYLETVGGTLMIESTGFSSSQDRERCAIGEEILNTFTT